MTARSPRGAAIYILELVIVGVVYFALANAGSTIATIYSNAMPIWAPAGLALAAVLLRGIRVWPAICVAAMAAGPPTDIADAAVANSILMSSAIAIGNTLQAVVGGYLINIWSHGRGTFDTPTGPQNSPWWASAPAA